MERMKPEILLLGDIPLIRETALLLGGMKVRSCCIRTDGQGQSPLPPMCKPVTTVPPSIRAAIELTLQPSSRKKENVRYLDAHLPAGAVLLTSSITVTATEQATWVRTPGRVVGVSALPGRLSQRLMELAPTIFTSREYVTAAEDAAILLGKEVAMVQDRIGMVLPRVLCSLVNEAFFAAMEGIAEAREIDIAMKLGTNYPLGPVEWGEQIGLINVVAILDALQRDTGESRYRVAPLLRQMALAARENIE